MNKCVIDMLVDIGVEREDIMLDDFGLIRDSNESDRKVLMKLFILFISIRMSWGRS